MISIHTYKGFEYLVQDEGDPEVCRVFHIVRKPDGTEDQQDDFDPYKVMTKAGFEAWVDLGCPSKQELGCTRIRSQTLLDALGRKNALEQAVNLNTVCSVV